MNSITWTMIIEESDDWTPIARPKHFDERKYAAASPAARKEFGKLKWDHKVKLGSLPPWPDAGKTAAPGDGLHDASYCRRNDEP